MPADNEKIYYQSDNVLITSTRAEMAGKTFVMSNITSVNLVEIPVEGMGCILPLCLVFVIFIAVYQVINQNIAVTLLMIICVVIFLVLGLMWESKREKPEYAVNISSASGETKVMQSNDLNNIEKIVAAIKQAIIDSGVQKVEAVSTYRVAKPADDLLQKLQSLKSLLDSGIISTQEYETKKAEILSRM